jgi:hypothetical protein
LWTVGFYDPTGKWQPETDCDSKEGAAIRVHFLNGGIVPRKIDEKFSSCGDIIKRSNGEIVPRDEPLFLIRARDRLAVKALLAYRVLSQEDACNDFHFEHLDKDIKAFKKFREEHPGRMKQPSITRGK